MEPALKLCNRVTKRWEGGSCWKCFLVLYQKHSIYCKQIRHTTHTTCTASQYVFLWHVWFQMQSWISRELQEKSVRHVEWICHLTVKWSNLLALLAFLGYITKHIAFHSVILDDKQEGRKQYCFFVFFTGFYI